MEMTAAIVLAADDPATLAWFYAGLLDVQPQPGLSASHWRVAWPAGGFLELYAPSRRRPQPRQQGRIAVCLQRPVRGQAAMEALQGWIERACTDGASLWEPPREESFGIEAWLLDPEGNGLLLMVLQDSAAPS